MSGWHVAGRLGGCLLLALALPCSAQSIGGLPVDAKLVGKMISGGVGLGEVANPPKIPTGLEIQRRGFGIVNEPRLEAALNDVLKDIQRAYPEKPVPARIYVTADPSPTAYASPDGGIFIAAGMLEGIESRDELAALVAHEYSHLLLNHAGRSTVQEMTRKAAGLGNLYLGLRYTERDYSDDLGSTATKQALGYGLAMAGMQVGLLPSRNRKQEMEADLLATELLAKARYNPVGMVDFLTRMEDWEAQQEALREAQEARELPLQEVWQQSLEQKGFAEAATNTAGAAVGNMFTRAGKFLNRGVSKISRKHVTPEQRMKAVREQMERQPSDGPRPDQRPLPWEGDANVARMFSGLEMAHDLVEAVEAGNSDRYPALVREVQSGPVANTAYGRYARFLVFDKRKGKVQSVRDMQQELKRPDSLYVTHYLVLDVMEEAGQAKEAVNALELSRASLGDPPELLPYSERIHRRAGNDLQANMAHAKCVGSGSDDLQAVCMKMKK